MLASVSPKKYGCGQLEANARNARYALKRFFHLVLCALLG